MGRIFCCGDIHGSAQRIKNIISQIDNPKEDDKIIICGDAGFEYMESIQGAAKKAAKKFSGSWIVLRGNHDSRYWEAHCDIKYDRAQNPCEWLPHNGWLFTENDQYLYQKKYSNILYVSDAGGLYNIEGYNFLFLPGAYSVDKDYRLQTHRPWNPKEQLSFREQYYLLDLVDSCNRNIPIDFVISHTFPLSWEPAYAWLFLNGIDQSKVDKSTEKFLDEIEKKLYNNYIHWFGGHFHYDMIINEKATMLFNKVIEIGEYCREG